MAAFSRRTEASEVRYDLTDRQRDTATLAAHARRVLNSGTSVKNHFYEMNCDVGMSG